MVEARRCLHCEAELPADAPEGVCPKCLLKLGLRSEKGGPSEADPSKTTPRSHRFALPDMDDLAKHFPQLEIYELIGSGGMGAVYKARQLGLDRPVALKILPPEVGQDPAFAERFSREARALAKLNHPNIVAVYDFGQTDGLYYLLMEFVEGVNLRCAIKAGHMEPRQTLAIVPCICDALQFAHEEGVVHRDIKPENILLDKKGRVKIADFGLAKLLGSTPAEFTLTGSQQAMGTPRYMAPEQMTKPHEVDHRADIYSLGVVFYEMLTGELPVGRFPPPSQKIEVDVRLDSVVLKTLEREPARRYQHASQVKTEVESIAAKSGAAALDTAARNDMENVQRRLFAPAIGLMITGAFFCLMAGAWVGTIAFAGRFIPEEGPLQLLWFIAAFWAALGSTHIPVFIGARKMMRLESYRWAVTGSIIAMLGIIPGLPIGIWALIELNRPNVPAAFAAKKRVSNRNLSKSEVEEEH